MSKSNFLNGLFLVLLYCACGCGSNSLYENVCDIQKGEWQKNQLVKFDVPIGDTINGYNLYFEIRNVNDYPYSNLFLFVTTTSPNKAVKKDTIELTLADEQGKWLGHGLAGIRNNEKIFKENIRFPLAGYYKFEIAQGMRDDVLKGIIDVGLKIKKVKYK
jgi:gliding motility-associated lipoprotein GldH